MPVDSQGGIENCPLISSASGLFFFYWTINHSNASYYNDLARCSSGLPMLGNLSKPWNTQIPQGRARIKTARDGVHMAALPDLLTPHISNKLSAICL